MLKVCAPYLAGSVQDKQNWGWFAGKSPSSIILTPPPKVSVASHLSADWLFQHQKAHFQLFILFFLSWCHFWKPMYRWFIFAESTFCRNCVAAGNFGKLPESDSLDPPNGEFLVVNSAENFRFKQLTVVTSTLRGLFPLQTLLKTAGNARRGTLPRMHCPCVCPPFCQWSGDSDFF